MPVDDHPQPVDAFAELHRRLRAVTPRLYVGQGAAGPAWAAPGQAVLVIGPPRVGKTSALVVPNVLAAPGPVVATSTKLDVVEATLAGRGGLGRCWLLDPSGAVAAPPGVIPLRWSPVGAAATWDDALVTARVMVTAARPDAQRGEAAHWSERAEALLAALLHAAAEAGAGMTAVVQWVLRHDLDAARATLDRRGAALAAAVLAGMAATDTRELSGIWSTTAGVLAAYRSEAALAASREPNFDAHAFVTSNDTVFVCAPARNQAVVAPVIVAFLEQVRAATYQAAAERALPLPTTFVLDEVANIAPLPDLPAVVAEGGGQGLLTLACLQDLSQARHRWGEQADGFLTLFGTKVILPGVADLATLQLVSRLGGEVDLPRPGSSQGPWWGPGRGARTVSWHLQRQPRLPLDAIRGMPAGTGLVLAGPEPPAAVRLPGWWEAPVLGGARAAVAPSPPPVAPRSPERPGADRRRHGGWHFGR